MPLRNVVVTGLTAALIVGYCAIPSAAQCPGDTLTILGGLQDDFAPPTEEPSPSESLRAYIESSWPQIADRQFDSMVGDRALIHTFAGILPGACGATLELHLRANSDELTWNDSVRLELVGDADFQQAFLYWTTIRNAIGSWGPGAEATFQLDLSDLPPYGGFPTNVLSALADGALDLLIEDDTAVDYAVLRVCYCSNATENKSWGRVKARFR